LTIVRDHNTRTVTLTPEKNSNPGLLKPGSIGTRRISVPAIAIPEIPEINIQVPRIVVPAIPPIDVTIPAPAPRPGKARTVII